MAKCKSLEVNTKSWLVELRDVFNVSLEEMKELTNHDENPLHVVYRSDLDAQSVRLLTSIILEKGEYIKLIYTYLPPCILYQIPFSKFISLIILSLVV